MQTNGSRDILNLEMQEALNLPNALELSNK